MEVRKLNLNYHRPSISFRGLGLSAWVKQCVITQYKPTWEDVVAAQLAIGFDRGHGLLRAAIPLTNELYSLSISCAAGWEPNSTYAPPKLWVIAAINHGIKLGVLS